VDVAAAAVRVVDPAVVLAAPVVRAADLAEMVGLAAARRVVIQFVRNAPIARSPNERLRRAASVSWRVLRIEHSLGLFTNKAKNSKAPWD
jgi:hypothetical protein